MYRRRAKDIIKLSRRLTSLRQLMLECLHYWKIRCEKRKTLVQRYQKAIELGDRLSKLEINFSQMFNRNHFVLQSKKHHISKKGEKLYPIFLNLNEINILRQFLSSDKRKKRFLRVPQGKYVPLLSRDKIQKLKRFLKCDWRYKKDI